MIRINCWFRLPFFGLSLNFVGIFWAYSKFRDLFWGFHSISLIFFGHSSSALIRINLWLKQYLEDLNRFNSWIKQFSRNWLRINSWLKWIAQELIQIHSRLKVLPIFRFKSTRDSSKKHLTLSRLMIRLWVISVSALYRTFQKLLLWSNSAEYDVTMMSSPVELSYQSWQSLLAWCVELIRKSLYKILWRWKRFTRSSCKLRRAHLLRTACGVRMEGGGRSALSSE